jgi:hypothetical protein
MTKPNIEIYGPGPDLRDIDPEELSPGVRALVFALREAGLFTVDSGDGSNYEAGMDCAMPYPHVFIMCPVAKLERVVELAREVLVAKPDLIDWPYLIDIMGDPLDEDGTPVKSEHGAVMIHHADSSEICKRVGYKGYDPEHKHE